ncbi:MAG TPA: 30S ribosome-binding factor RbfA [Casimicrobiaceae bacterium]|nr:30S ribosome-binding factor RbfA [Casimicrobiaceae bacterium]
MKSQRTHRLAEQIQHELAELLRTEVKDPRVGMVTVTHVDVSADVAHAKVYFTSLSGREHAKAVTTALSRTAGFLRSQLARRLNVYTVPELAFVYDESIESGMHLSRLIDEAVAEDRKHPKE